MQRCIALLSFLVLFFSLIPYKQVSAKEGYFVVTAYYSPLPDQNYYMTGNFESEKRLQGHGIAGASGRKVFSGMLAAPSKYSFGTKVYIEGLGIGDVQDRGGAIVPAGKRGYSYDRLDVWMGYGDEGLRRALAWGKRTVPGYVVGSSSQVTINYKDHIAPHWAVKNLKHVTNIGISKKKSSVVKKEKTIFDISIGKESLTTDIKKLQSFFKKIGIYQGSVDGVYNQELIYLVLDFQIANDIISSKTDLGAGYWGPKTRTVFKNLYTADTFSAEVYFKNIQTKITSKQRGTTTETKLELNEEVTKKQAKEKQEATVKEKKEEEGIFTFYNKTKEEQKKILEALMYIGEYKGVLVLEETEFIDVIYGFQFKNGLVKDSTDIGAGYYGPATRKLLKEKYISQKSKEEKIQRITDVTTKKIQYIGNLEEGTTSDSVRELQKLLAELGYFHADDTAYFGSVTKQSVIDFQLDFHLIDASTSKYAGIVGDRTLETLGTEYHKYLVGK